MLRRIVTIAVMLAVLFQGVAVTGAATLDESRTTVEHCPMESGASPDCVCCDGQTVGGAGCAAMCNLAATASVTIGLPFGPRDERIVWADVPIPDPPCLPANPPPIA
jgi:hypothetical protein